jgi:hypothetical protein
MAEKQVQQVRNIYGEILGIGDHLPTGTVKASVTDLYNAAVDELNKVSGSDYSRFKIGTGEYIRLDIYRADSVRAKIASLLARLEQEFGFHKPLLRGESQPSTNIVTINNNNQLSVTVVPIQEILQRIIDPELRVEVEELKTIIEGDKDMSKASRLLNAIQQKSWDVFIALLPVVLERLGKSH